MLNDTEKAEFNKIINDFNDAKTLDENVAGIVNTFLNKFSFEC